MIALESLSLGEILQKAGLNTLLGMGVVFIVLILISLLIYCMRFIPLLIDSLTGKRKKETASEEESVRTAPAAPAAVSRAAAPSAAAAAGEEADWSLIAVITAAIAAEADVPADGIVIRSIRRSAKNNWKRA